MPNIITSDLEELVQFLVNQDILFAENGYAYQADYEFNSLEKLKEYVLKREAAQLEEADAKLIHIRDRSRYIIQRHDKRTLVTSLGELVFTRTYYYDRQEEKYTYLLDEKYNLPRDERISTGAEVLMLQNAASESFEKTAALFDGQVTKQTVMDKVHDIPTDYPLPVSNTKKYVKYLFIEADEDHFAHQGDQGTDISHSMIGKLIYLYEGKENICSGRRKLVGSFYLGGMFRGGEANRRLWEQMQQYIESNYDEKTLKAVYINSDCGSWIQAGFSCIDKAVPVIDKYHLMIYINRAAKQVLDDEPVAKERLWKAVRKGKKKKIRKIMTEIRTCAKNRRVVDDCEIYLLNNLEAAKTRMQDSHVYGSSTEGHVSHVLSERMSSRPMAWSENGADKMCFLRCFVQSYGKEKIKDLVEFRRQKELLKATGTDDSAPVRETLHMSDFIHEHHDSDRAYIEKLQATIPYGSVRKTIAIRNRLNNI